MGRPLRDRAGLRRIRQLAIPPAWTAVWICATVNGHLQATGLDARGRKQYRYHPRFRALRDADKFGRLGAFGAALPRLRRHVRADLRRQGLPRERVLAAVVALLDRTRARVGNDEYARDNGSFGLTTLRDAHADVGRRELVFEFPGKSGGEHRLRVVAGALARVVRRCQELPGQRLFQYLDERGRRHRVGSTDVNRYLRDSAGIDCSAKDFRTWHGSVEALAALARADPVAHRERSVVEVVRQVAARLGNTRAVCRKYYIAPAVFDAFLSGRLAAWPVAQKGTAGLNAAERQLLALLAHAPAAAIDRRAA